MSSSAPEVAESSRARQEAEQEPESEPQRKWVALVSIPDILGDEDERAKQIAVGTHALLDLNNPPLPSYLVLHPLVAPNPRRNDGPLSAYILAADHRSACFLLRIVEGNQPDFFLYDTHRRIVTILPPVSSYIQTSKSININPELSIGLIADPLCLGHYVVAQLHPRSTDAIAHPSRLLCYSTATRRWFTRDITVQLQQEGMRNPFTETCVLAHDGQLWWISLAYGVFFCDPCAPLLQVPHLRFLPFPDDCEMGDDVAFDLRIRNLLNRRRCVRPSEGKLRFVEIRGPSYDNVLVEVPAPNPTVRMWTLDDPEGHNPWTLEYEVAFAEIWENKTYADAGLLPCGLPDVGLVDPNNHYVVYFFQGSKLFGLDMREKKVVACEECQIDRDQLQLWFRYSRPIVDAWELPPPPSPILSSDDDPSPADNVSPRQSDAEEMESKVAEEMESKVTEEMERKVNEHVESWLDQARLARARGTDASFENRMPWQMSPPRSDETSVNSGGQTDDSSELQFPLSP